MDNKIRKRATRMEMIQRLKNQNAKYEAAIAKNIEKIAKLEANASSSELLEKIEEAGLTVAEVIRMIDGKK